MKPIHLIVISCAGLVAGWWLASPSSSRDQSEQPVLAENERPDRIRGKARQEMLEILLSEGEQERFKRANASNLSELLAMLRYDSNADLVDINRIVDLGARAALSQLLADPAASGELCGEIAKEWARREPEQAIAWLRSQTSYRGEDCLFSALVAAYPASPGRVVEVLKSLPRNWQERHLKEIFSGNWRVRAAGAPPEVPSGDPFADDGHWVELSAGQDLMDSLADDRLREQAQKLLQPEDPEPSAPAGGKPRKLNLASYEGDWESGELLREELKNHREDTIARVAESGNYEARSSLMGLLQHPFPFDRKDWPQGLAKMEDLMNRLGVVPDLPRLPRAYPELFGPEVAGWIERQPIALQRAWASEFVGNWVTQEPQQAVDWARNLPKTADRDAAFQSGMVVWAHQHPPDAAAYAVSLPTGEMRESAISNTAAAWWSTDRAGARAWLDSLPTSSGQQRGLERVK